MKTRNHENGVISIDEFISESECKDLIRYGETLGYDEAAINSGGEQVVFKQVRNNDRLFFDDEDRAQQLFMRINGLLNFEFPKWEPLELNERFRFYRYRKGQYFKWHRDGSFVRSTTEESKLTFMIYLNGNYEGGQTEFKDFSITPQAGMALIFPHPLFHQGATITAGVKYVLRTDVMYRWCP